MAPRFRVEALDFTHDRSAFSSGSPALDRYLREQASQEVRKNVTRCFVAVSDSDGSLAGYYTLSAFGVDLTDIHTELTKKLPKYPVVPATLIGRLAVARAFQKMGLGKTLLFDAYRRVARSDIGVFAVLVEAKDDAAAAFYKSQGFVELPAKHGAYFCPSLQREGFSSKPSTSQRVDSSCRVNLSLTLQAEVAGQRAIRCPLIAGASCPAHRHPGGPKWSPSAMRAELAFLIGPF